MADARRALLPRTAPDALARHRADVRVRVVASRTALLLAVLGVLSALVRPLWQELPVVREVLPGLVPVTSRAALLLVSTLLLLTARGLRTGSRLAWGGTLAVLGVSAALHLTKGLHVVESVVVAVGALWLAAHGRAFPVLPTRRAVRLAVLVSAAAVVLAAVAVAASAWAPATGRADAADRTAWGRVGNPLVTGLAVLFLVTLFWSLLSPRRPVPLGAGAHLAERERARALVEQWGGGTLDYFALRDDKDWFVSGRTVVAHAVRGGVCLVSPDPIGPPDERVGAWADFLEHAQEAGWSVSVVAASADWLPVYEASGLRPLYLGDEATVDCRTFTLHGRAHKSLRQSVGRIVRLGYVTTFHDPVDLAPDLRDAIAAMSDESRRGEQERGFSMTLSRLFDPLDTGLLLSVTRAPDGRVDAFCQWVPARDIDGWSLDVMRRRTDEGAPNGLVEETIVATVEELRRRGCRGLGLNFAVLRDVLEGEGRSRLDELARQLLRRLSQGTQAATLGAFNEKFDPSWTPRYLVLDPAEYVATQALAVAGAEGVTEIPVIGRFLAPRGTPS
ncbi:bifunctional lysylphosphatidylglycerol flippase/synthetase MprF [Cellulomonas shaoxiangyii]|uniref:DUF2156 domain-containing protein n=1 Tax=Cellulomonas shaoxiangyii TaxID=2566013 RepID=A0A4P7SIF5_9CELL|nr:DUF2156 domain-containing protein [Cellulomonas shaoxiangyii]QCB93541.1 DUF2156 domain-containing protein [Cellulomonas shaoxiangyii]TGY86863.1 DUF2156 domain-containing protein [Cellulomonas shaoxiangyii]